MTSKFTLPETDDTCYGINYEFSSAFGNIEFARYRQNIVGDIIVSNCMLGSEMKETTIGRVEIDKLLIGNAMNAGASLIYLFDETQFIQDVVSELWDFRRMTWKKALLTHYNDDIIENDLLILSRLEILPQWRGKGLGRYVVRDVYNNFISGAGLFTLKCFAIQGESFYNSRKEEAFNQAMRYDLFTPKLDLAFNTLLQYYKDMGLDYLPRVSRELLFINPARVNVVFDEIDLNRFDDERDGAEE